MSPEDEQYLREWLAENTPVAGPLCEVVQNIFDEPVPQRVKKRLSEPLLPGKYKPVTPPRKKKEIKRQVVLKEFDPVQPTKKREEKSYKDILPNLLKKDGEKEGVEREGRCFTFWKKVKVLQLTLQNILWER